MSSWLVLQIADSAFPAGGFAHSSGLEAAVQLGEIKGGEGLEKFARACAWQAGYGALPFVGAAHERPTDLAEIDATCDAFLTSAVGNRASRTQGRAFVATCARVFETKPFALLDESARDGTIHAHLAPLFGATLRALDLPKLEAQALYLHLALRGVTSAAVRLGVVGPHEAQRIQRAHAVTLDAVIGTCASLTLDDVAQPAPIYELLGSTQDRLYSKLFQS